MSETLEEERKSEPFDFTPVLQEFDDAEDLDEPEGRLDIVEMSD
jgi:hypothetical protein|tara:strand:- start:332 stop:463 length:132 start_codon:yes stop_codon:yes gene_type:complete